MSLFFALFPRVYACLPAGIICQYVCVCVFVCVSNCVLLCGCVCVCFDCSLFLLPVQLVILMSYKFVRQLEAKTGGDSSFAPLRSKLKQKIHWEKSLNFCIWLALTNTLLPLPLYLLCALLRALSPSLLPSLSLPLLCSSQARFKVLRNALEVNLNLLSGTHTSTHAHIHTFALTHLLARKYSHFASIPVKRGTFSS